ncbi:metallophosphoesterase family protein, partial [Niveibacterium sp.]|uniref:metallophosphoesterase family protein n=1 Tax=Niveibacterium sp. TaxID=2017444 RepID=UPI0035B0637F
MAGVDHIVHAGDIGRPDIVDALRRIAPVTAIRGNADTGEWAHEYADTELVRLAGKSIYVLHDLKTLHIDPRADIDVIVCGHSSYRGPTGRTVFSTSIPAARTGDAF